MAGTRLIALSLCLSNLLLGDTLTVNNRTPEALLFVVTYRVLGYIEQSTISFQIPSNSGDRLEVDFSNITQIKCKDTSSYSLYKRFLSEDSYGQRKYQLIITRQRHSYGFELLEYFPDNLLTKNAYFISY